MPDISDSILTDAVIIGKGPAGIQAALHIARSGLGVTVIGHDAGSLALAEKVENYYGLPEPASGAAIQKNGEAQARSLGVAIHECQAVGFGFDGGYIVKTTLGMFRAKAVLLATGVKRIKVPIKDIGRFDGKGVSYCAVCDGFLYKGKNTAVLGYSEYALAEARELAALNGKTTILTNGEPPRFGIGIDDIDPALYEIVNDRIAGLEGEDRLAGIRFQNDGLLELDALFIAYGVAGSSDLARKLGVLVNPRGDILTDQAQATNVPGIFAAGDCTGVFRQIAVAVGQGAIAASHMIEYIRKLQ